VVNATGVVLHTNLGRAVLAPGAAAAVAEAAAAYSDLELDLASGRRGDRLGAVGALLARAAGAEAGLAVNNNAAAVLLIANTFAGRRPTADEPAGSATESSVGPASPREVVISRGELVEIGGSFRVPEVMERAGVRLVEVGTTNRTRASDYAAAIGPRTGLLLKVHRSNFEQRGFVEETPLEALVELGLERGVPVAEDLGSATLLDLRDRGLPPESYAPARVAAGADLVCFSGDKLLGGPQAGLVLGREAAVAELRRNPLARALRLDKLSLAALDWTLRAVLDGRAETEIPVVRQLAEPLEQVEARARVLAARLLKAVGPRLEVAVEPARSPVGGGSLPGFELDTWVVSLRDAAGAARLAARLRHAPVPVLSRVRDDRVLLDPRTLLPGDEADIDAALGGDGATPRDMG
jgi:L-seryl-tRNA(Ser) seleniumtransferase